MNYASNKWFELIDHTDTPSYEVVLRERVSGGLRGSGSFFMDEVDALDYVLSYLKDHGSEDIAVDYGSFSIALPDPSLSIDDLKKYGYDSGYEMLPLSKERAMEIRDKADITVYALYDDNTEAAIDDVRQFDTHKGLFGIEIDDWKIARERLAAVDIYRGRW